MVIAKKIYRLYLGRLYSVLRFHRKFGNLIMGLKKIQQKKPNFCELYLISGGKLIFLKEENNEGFIEDDQGVMIAKLNKKRGTFKGWIGKMYPRNPKSPSDSPSSSSSADSPSIWERSAEEIEEYFNKLLDSNEDEEESGQASNAILENNGSTELDIPQDLVNFLSYYWNSYVFRSKKNKPRTIFRIRDRKLDS